MIDTDPSARTDELWARCYVADDEQTAIAQALRQLSDFAGDVLAVSDLTATGPDGWGPIELADPLEVRPLDVFDLESWHDGELVPEWRIAPVDPDAVLRCADGTTVALRDLSDLGYTAPAIGTLSGFGPLAGRTIVLPD